MPKQSNTDLLLIHPPYHRRRGSGTVFPIGLGYLSAAAQDAGFNVSVLDCALHFESLDSKLMGDLSHWLVRHITDINPNIAIGIGPCTTSAVRALKPIAEACDKVCPNIPTIYGGPLASIPGQDKIFFDDLSATCIVNGDGERPVCDLLHALRDGNAIKTISGVQTKHSKAATLNLITDLDKLPFPERNGSIKNIGYELSARRNLFASPFANISTSRGCKYDCPFCVSGQLRNGLYHRRSNQSIVKEIEHLHNYFGIRTVVFYDDTFFLATDSLDDEIMAFVKNMEIFNGQILWQVEMRPDIILKIDGKIATALYKAGCRQINIGIEKAHSHDAAALGKRFQPDSLRKTVEEIHSKVPEMRLTGTFILGGAEENQDTISNLIEYATSLKLIFAHFYPLEIYPGTKLYNDVFGEQDVLAWYRKVMMDNRPWGEIIYENESLSCDDLLESIKHCYRLFYEREEWHNYAKQMLGSYYSQTVPLVSKWLTDRFRLE